MAALVKKTVDAYSRFMAEKSDPRTQDWFLMSSPGPLLAILAVYLWGCTRGGPWLMRNREPFKLTNTLIAYNAIQVVGSLWLFYEGLESGWLRDYSFRCQPVDYSNDPKAIRMAGAVWYYFIFKVIELLDTIFFVLRKKMNQVSFLHLYHHTMMPICAWVGCKFLPGGHGTLLGLINTFVHVIMYFYYMLAAMGPGYQKYLWWKPHVTIIQMIQFVVVFAHTSQLFFTECNYPKSIAMLLAINALAFLYMFGSFYYHAYVVAPRADKARADRKRFQSQESQTLIQHKIANGNGVLLVNNNVLQRNGNGIAKKDN